MNGTVIAFGCRHPQLGPSRRFEPERADAVRADGRVRFASLSEEVVRSTRLRYVPYPSLLLLHAIAELLAQPGAREAVADRERVGLFVDTNAAFRAVQEEFFGPVLEEGESGASPLLFPHTSEASAVSIAAVNFDLRGPCLALEPTEPRALLEVAGGFFESGAIDAALVGALSCGAAGDTAAEDAPALVDTAAVLLFTGRPDTAMAPVADGPEWIRRTGPCAWLYREAWRRGIL